MKRVLIITYSFPPYNYGLRAFSLYKYLPERNWIPKIVALTGTDKIFEDKIKDVEYITNSNINTYKLNFIKRFIYIDKSWAGNQFPEAYRICEKHINSNKFDLILATSCNVLHVFTLAYEMSRKFKIPWIADVRDINEQFGKTLNKSLIQRLANFRYYLRRNYLLKRASAVVTISEWHQLYLSQILKRKIHLIFNGYDPELFSIIQNETLATTSTFNILFIGSLSNDRLQGLQLLVEAITLLKVKYGLTDINLHLVGWRQNVIIDYLNKKKFDFIKEEGQVSINEIEQLMKAASLLVIFSNPGFKGVMGTKVFEYLTARKPIICLPVDDGTISNLLEKTQSGLSFNTSEELASYLMSLYESWKLNGYTFVKSDITEIAKFSRKEQVFEFVSLMDKSIDPINISSEFNRIKNVKE